MIEGKTGRMLDVYFPKGRDLGAVSPSVDWFPSADATSREERLDFVFVCDESAVC